jgi:hypothetical protein
MSSIEQVPADEIKDWTPIRIEGPLPNMVAVALIQAIGNMWPEATIQGNASRHLALDMRVPPNTQPEDLDQEFIDQIRKNVDEGHEDLEFLGFRDGWVAFAPPEELCLHLGNVAHSIFKSHEPDAINHVEWEVKTGNEADDPSYVLSISKSKGQTPLAMRKAAEAEVQRLKAILDMEGIEY